MSGSESMRRATGKRSQIESDLPPVGHYIGGEFRAADNTEVLDIVDPATEEVIARMPLGTGADVDSAVRAATDAKQEWAALVPKERADILLAIADRLLDSREILVRLESANTGKPWSVANDDIDGSVDSFRFMAGAIRSGTSASAGNYAENHLSVILREPLGIVGVVAPWNYPLLTAAEKIAAILAAGNTIIIKPSELTPLTTLKFAELSSDLLPAGVLNVVSGTGPTVGAELARHPGIDMMSLTGSSASGRAVAEAAADTLKRVHLELGGKAPVVVFEDANLDLVAATLRSASFYNSGQDCGAACRVLVHESVADDLVKRLAAQVSELRVGDPGAGEDIEVGPLVSRAHYDRVLGHLEAAYQEGARAAIGGSAYDGPGFYIQPTVLVNIPLGAACARDEIFGPVVTVETFRNEDEAIERANDVPVGLAASVWTEDARRSHGVATKIDAGTVWVNCHSVLLSELPWGGFKGSGYGRDMSIYALDDYSRTKHVMHNHQR